MDVQIRDAAALRRVSPAMLRAYLEARGWMLEETWRNRVMVWSKAGSPEARDLLAPLREQSEVYAVRIAEAVARLAELEERSQLDVYYDLLSAGADTIRLRTRNGVEQAGWNLNDSADFLALARDLLTASARYAERPGLAVYRGRASGTVTDYVRGVRALPGYAAGNELTLHSPVPAGYGVQRDLGDGIKPPFPRQATLALHNSLREADRTVLTVIGGAAIAPTFESVASAGVSANLCDAISTLAQRGHGIGISVHWADARPASIPADEFSFSESAAEIFGDAAKLLRLNSPFLDAHITGEIVRLHREQQDEFEGQAVVMCELDRRPVALDVQFDFADREKVLSAFRDGVAISLDGDIHRIGNKYEMRNPRNFVAVKEQQ